MPLSTAQLTTAKSNQSAVDAAEKVLAAADIAQLAAAQSALNAAVATQDAYLLTLVADAVIPPPPPVNPPATQPTFKAAITGLNQVTLSWTNVSPTKLGHDQDSWDTGPLVNQPTTGSFAMNFLIPGDTYTFTLTYAGGILQVTIQNPPTTPPPVVTPPAGGVAPLSPATIGSTAVPTKVLLDEEFSSGALNKSLWSTVWFVDGATQNNTVMKSANVSVDANGLELKLDTSNQGSIVSSNPSDGVSGHTGLALDVNKGPVFVQYKATLPETNGQLANWPALWLTGQQWPATGEIDVMEGFGDSEYHIELTPPGGAFENPGGSEGTPAAGQHVWGVLWEKSKVTFLLDGVVKGVENVSIPGPLYIVMENSSGGPKVLGVSATVRDVQAFQ